MRFALTFVMLVCTEAIGVADPQPDTELAISWEKGMLTITGDSIPGEKIPIWYLEAYCRPGSTDRDWSETVIKHESELIEASADGKTIRLKDTLSDGVFVEHKITAKGDQIDFVVTAHNPTAVESQAHWAQPCIRVDRFTGCGKADARARVPEYAKKCFVFIDGEMTRLPTVPWKQTARYTPGQVYGAPSVSRLDLNPRPLSRLTPSIGLCGCFSADEKMVLAVAWEPYQEIFQGVIACIHSDFRIGGLLPGETKHIRGRIYVVPADIDALHQRYLRDFKITSQSGVK